MPPSLTIITYLFPQPIKWRLQRHSPYEAVHVNALYAACKEHIKIPHRFVCITNHPGGLECEHLPCPPPIVIDNNEGCYRRLHAFSEEFARNIDTDFIALIDLDVVLMEDCTKIFDWAMKRDFCILRGSPRTLGDLCNLYNGGFWVCRKGARQQFWQATKHPNINRKRNQYRLPSGKRAVGSDQALMAMTSPHEQVMGEEHGILQYRYHRQFPTGSKMVFFAGSQKPWSDETLSKAPTLYRQWMKYAKVKPKKRPVGPLDKITDPSEVLFFTFKWGQQYTAEHVNALHSRLQVGMRDMPFKLVCVTDQAADVETMTWPLWKDHRNLVNPAGKLFPNCYPRLKLFSRPLQEEMGIPEGAKMCCIDLDMLPVDDLRPIFDRGEPFLGWMVKGSRQQTVYNGSLWMFKAGYFTDIWEQFDPVNSPRQARQRQFFGSDQAILSNEFMVERGIKCGWTEDDGLYAFRVLRGSSRLPEGARLVAFYGRYKPWDEAAINQTPWLKRVLQTGGA